MLRDNGATSSSKSLPAAAAPRKLPPLIGHYKVLEEINRAKQARGPVNPADKQTLPKDLAAKDPPKAGIPFEIPASAQSTLIVAGP